MTTASTAGTRVALVTGGSGGIGSSVVERLAQDGFAVAVHYAGHPERAEALAAKVRAADGQAIAVGGDVADEVASCAAGTSPSTRSPLVPLPRRSSSTARTSRR